MTEHGVPETLDALDVFVGEWRMTASLSPDPDDPARARTTFEWLPGRRFLIQRWQVDHPDAPDGIAVIGIGADEAGLVQHYFDSRGVARRYQMTFADRVWTLVRFADPPDFCQRFAGTFERDGHTIVGGWESSSDGEQWTPDFTLTYTRVR
jgi:hypothetical protein